MAKFVGVNDRGQLIGKFHHRCKYPDELIDRIRALHEEYFFGYRAISKALDVPRSTVRQICLYNRRAQAYTQWKKVGGT